mmetsp:Transcript_59019/g.164917  ORF Transcript_59019/g.164917 Transcript_59019/m.164917 type:complete len:223 (+) Transcript_59019:556-1224(+)
MYRVMLNGVLLLNRLLPFLHMPIPDMHWRCMSASKACATLAAQASCAVLVCTMKGASCPSTFALAMSAEHPAQPETPGFPWLPKPHEMLSPMNSMRRCLGGRGIRLQVPRTVKPWKYTGSACRSCPKGKNVGSAEKSSVSFATSRVDCPGGTDTLTVRKPGFRSALAVSSPFTLGLKAVRGSLAVNCMRTSALPVQVRCVPTEVNGHWKAGALGTEKSQRPV